LFSETVDPEKVDREDRKGEFNKFLSSSSRVLGPNWKKERERERERDSGDEMK
jgi:hypothetical protein